MSSTSNATWNVENPYVGPRTFAAADKDFFFGRNREADNLAALVVTNPVVLFYAPSGAGKSSLINARLAPLLDEEERMEILPVARVGGALPPHIDPVTVKNIFAFNVLLKLAGADERGESLTATTLTEYLDKKPQSRLLIIDQFEEIITTHPERWEERQVFFSQIHNAVKKDPKLQVLLSLREDYVAALDRYDWLLPGKLRSRFYMGRLHLEAALEAIREPARAAGRPFAPDVAEQLVHNLSQLHIAHNETGALSGEFIEPLQLQIVCHQLWEQVKSHPPGEISMADLQQCGDVDTALGDFYESMLHKAIQAVTNHAVPPVSEFDLRNWFNNELVTSAGTRGTVFRGETTTGALPNAVVDHLKPLVRDEVRAGGIWYELCHDRFVEPIRAANQAWLAANPLIRDAQSWHEANLADKEKLLYQGQRLADALVLPHRENLGTLVAEFLQAGQQAEYRQQAEERNRKLRLELTQAQLREKVVYVNRLRWLLAGVVSLLVLLSVGTIVLVKMYRGLAETESKLKKANTTLTDQKDQADKLRKEAERERQNAVDQSEKAVIAQNQARSGQYAAQATKLIATNPATALGLSVQANRTFSTFEAQNSLLQALQYEPRLGKFIHRLDRSVIQSQLSSIGQTLTTWTKQTGKLALFDLATNQLRKSIILPTDLDVDSFTFAINPTARYVATTYNQTLLLWDVTPNRLISWTLPISDEITSLAFAPTQPILAASQQDGTVLRWDLNNKQPIGPPLTTSTTKINNLAISPDGKMLAIGNDDGSFNLWKFEPVTQIFTGTSQTTDGIGLVRFSPDGALLAVGDNQGGVALWDTTRFQRKRLLQASSNQQSKITALTFSSDNHSLAVGNDIGQIKLWDSMTGQEKALPLRGHCDGQTVADLFFAADNNQQLFSTTVQGETLRWNLAGRSRLITATITAGEALLSVAYSSDGNTAALGGSNGTIILWQPSTNLTRLLTSTNESAIVALAYQPDHATLVAGREDGSLWIWNQSPVPSLHLTRTETTAIRSLAFSPDGQTLVTGYANGMLTLWDTESWQSSQSITITPQYSINSLVFSPDGRSLLAATGDTDQGATILWHVSEKILDKKPYLQKRGFPVWAGDFNVTGRIFAAGWGDNQFTVYSTATPFLNRPSPYLAAAILTLRFSPHQPYLVVVDSNRAINMWEAEDLQTLRQIGEPLIEHQDTINGIAFRPDGQALVSVSADQQAILWDFDLQSWQRKACAIIQLPDSNTADDKQTLSILPLLSISPCSTGPTLSSPPDDALKPKQP